MLKDYMSILNLSENDDNLKNLTRNRPLASIPIGGRYRVIDFILSNIVNSGISNVGIFTQSNSRSLVDHLGSGKPWDLDRRSNGLFVFNFGISTSHLDDVEMIRNNFEYFHQSKQEKVILASSYMVCNIDLEEAAKAHEASGSDITVIFKRANDCKTNFINCDTLNIEDGMVTSFGINIGVEDECNVCMEMFIMKKQLLLNILQDCIKKGYSRNLKDAIYRNAKNLNINPWEFKGYLSCINSIKAYYKSSMDILDLKVNNELFYKNGLVYTKVKYEPPTIYVTGANISNALVANGCKIRGSIEDSIIFRRVDIGKGAEIKNCIIMQGCTIGKGARLNNIIIDKNVIIEDNKTLKGDEEFPLVIEKKPLFG